MSTFNPASYEPKWQRFWVDRKTFRTNDSDFSKPKFYVLDMFPYPSGAGLHVGHPEGYTATDIVARYKRMKGFNVLHPIGWDAFGLPAEQYALKTGTHPRITTNTNIARFREQLQAIGFSYDWDREVDTTDPAYYKWTQWIFLKLYEKGLAYEHDALVNWCPALGTVLANEEVIDGKSEVGGHPVERRPMRQWMLRITRYAERLLEDLDLVDWPESIKEMQRNWIGKSTGAEISFQVNGSNEVIRVFTTRPDTLFGATYMVLSPEHPALKTIVPTSHTGQVERYQQEASKKSDLERSELSKEKTGVFTGAFAINPATSEPIPVWVADYVLMGYGTGAIMAVPGHDERDWEFARQFDLKITEVVSGGDISKAAFTDNEKCLLVHSENNLVSLNGLTVPEAKERIIQWLEASGIGKKQVNYKLRDWLFSRQRYWGEPFPVIHVDGEPVPLSNNDLPVTLPELDDYKPTGEGRPPLARATEWLKTTDLVSGKPALRETNTMPQWAGSCWYYLRYIDPAYEYGPVNPEKEKYWMPVDLYVGGAEHAVLHLLYARFWHKVLFDCGVVSTKEPFQKLVNQGLILGEMEFTAFRGNGGNWLNPDEAATLDGVEKIRIPEEDVEKRGEFFFSKSTGARLDARSFKMSKSRGNVVNPDDVIKQYGSDALRLYEMFMGPLEQVKPWNTRGVDGVFRFLGRIWRLVVDEATGGLNEAIQAVEPDRSQLKSLHEVIKKVTEDIEAMRFNTAISAMMIFVNDAYKWSTVPVSVLEPFLVVLSPFAPHIAEEIWQRLAHNESIAKAEWPVFDEQYLVAETFTYGIQVNGKVRGELTVAASEADSREIVLGRARQVDSVKRWIEGKPVVKEVFVARKIVNIVVAG